MTARAPRARRSEATARAARWPVRVSCMLLALAFCGAVAAAPSPATADTEAPAPGDTAAAPAPPSSTADVVAALGAYPALADVRATRSGSLVVLQGEVGREADRELATKLAGAVPGVDEVIDRTTVSYSLDRRLGDLRTVARARMAQLLTALPLLALAVLVVWVSWRLGRRLARSRFVTRRAGARNPFLASIAGQAVVVIATLAGLLVALQLLDALALAGAIAGSAGILGITLGFAFRDIAENYIASLLLSVRRPFSPDDSVVIGGHEGIVVGLDSRTTLLLTPDGNHLRLPNATVFKAAILNHTRNPQRRFGFTMRLAPDADADVALKEGLRALRDVPGVLDRPDAVAQLRTADHEWLEAEYYAWVDQRASNYAWARSEAIRRVRLALSCAGLAFRRPVLAVAAVGPATAADDEGPAETAAPVAPPTSEKDAVQPAVSRARDEMAHEDLIGTPPADPAAAPGAAGADATPR